MHEYTWTHECFLFQIKSKRRLNVTEQAQKITNSIKTLENTEYIIDSYSLKLLKCKFTVSLKDKITTFFGQ